MSRTLRPAAAIAFAACAFLGGCAAPRPADPEATSLATDAIAVTALRDHDIPGLALVVMREDRVLVQRGYGVRNGEAPVTAHTVFQLGSIGKQFLAALVMALAEEGRLSLDDPVARHLPDFPLLPPELRVRHLLSHTAGLRELFTLPEARAGFSELDRGVGELRAAVRKASVDFAPGSRWSYSNTNYTLLAFIVESIERVPYHEALARRFFRPLGLASLRQCTPLPSGADEARGHARRADRVVLAAPENMSWAWGDGGICGNALDVARWMRLLATGRVVSPASYARMTTATRLAGGADADYGYAISLVAPDGMPKRAHNGAMAGFSASAAYYPQTEVGIVVLTNLGDVRSEVIERRIARVLHEIPPPALVERPLSAAERSQYTGTYDIGVFRVRVSERNATLWLEMPRPGPTTPLRHLGGGEFAAEVAPEAYRVTFSGTPGALEMRLLMGAMHWYGMRAR